MTASALLGMAGKRMSRAVRGSKGAPSDSASFSRSISFDIALAIRAKYHAFGILRRVKYAETVLLEQVNLADGGLATTHSALRASQHNAMSYEPLKVGVLCHNASSGPASRALLRPSCVGS